MKLSLNSLLFVLRRSPISQKHAHKRHEINRLMQSQYLCISQISCNLFLWIFPPQTLKCNGEITLVQMGQLLVVPIMMFVSFQVGSIVQSNAIDWLPTERRRTSPVNTERNSRERFPRSPTPPPPPPAPRITIYVATISGVRLSFEDLEPHTVTVQHVKRLISRRERIPVRGQTLMFQRQVISDERTLAHYGVPHEGLLHLVLDPPGQ